MATLTITELDVTPNYINADLLMEELVAGGFTQGFKVHQTGAVAFTMVIEADPADFSGITAIVEAHDPSARTVEQQNKSDALTIVSGWETMADALPDFMSWTEQEGIDALDALDFSVESVRKTTYKKMWRMLVILRDQNFELAQKVAELRNAP